MSSLHNGNTSDSDIEEKRALLNTYHRTYSDLSNLKADSDDASLDTLADSIRFIIKRDSAIALAKKLRTSPWRLDSILRSPMLSSPHLMAIPDLQKRRDDQVKKHQLQREEARLLTKIKRDRAESFNEEVGYSQEVEISNEDEQWERKRLKKLQKVLRNSSSSISSASSIGFESENSYSPTQDILKDLREEFAKTKNPTSVSIMYGIVNTVIVLPVLMSFGSIIYHDEFFRPYMPVLVKLTVVSGVVHQICFSTFSTLPFAVGQVQDAGLIFLSSIASGIVAYCKEHDKNDEEILATTLVGLSLFTASLGLFLILIGKLKLASYVEALPTTVIGGYLAFIGFFCGQGGLCLMAGVQVSGIMEWYKFLHEREILLILPGILGGLGIYLSIRTVKHMAVLPLSVASIMLAFYITLTITGTTIAEAKELGWVNQADPPPVWYHTWDYIQFDKVIWNAIFPGQLLTFFSMVFVVALSSSLDIAAIDLEIPKPLEYNYELRMVGLSNVISGITGGYTGSYIFSQSIFSLRAGIRSRLMGYVIAICEAITVVIPVSIISYVPNFVFGCLLIMICIDLMVEWLWDVRKKLSKAEYFVALSTFVLIQCLSVEFGIIAGVIVHIMLLKMGFNVGNKSSKETDLEVRSPSLPAMI